jgi:hypothetical protein
MAIESFSMQIKVPKNSDLHEIYSEQIREQQPEQDGYQNRI